MTRATRFCSFLPLQRPARISNHKTILTSLNSHTSPQSPRLTHSKSSAPSPPTMSAASQSQNWEASIKRNPHPDFSSVESSRPPFDTASTFRYTRTPLPAWPLGSGANAPPPAAAAHVSIDPYEAGRPAGFNYKLLISAVVPRPIAFVSTRSADGKTNLAPFSYFQVVNHDPPLFTIGIASAVTPADKSKDTLRNLHETGECVINIISEHFVEAANATSVNAPYGVSEWDVSGLTPVYDCHTVKCARVKEAVFSVEAKLESLKEFESRSKPGTTSGTLVIVEGTRFWVREDGINEERNMVDPEVCPASEGIGGRLANDVTQVLKPVSRLGGITYGRLTEAFELPRPDFEKDVGGTEAVEALKEKDVSN